MNSQWYTEFARAYVEFPWLSHVRMFFSRLSEPGNCKLKFSNFSSISRTHTHPVSPFRYTGRTNSSEVSTCNSTLSKWYLVRNEHTCIYFLFHAVSGFFFLLWSCSAVWQLYYYNNYEKKKKSKEKRNWMINRSIGVDIWIPLWNKVCCGHPYRITKPSAVYALLHHMYAII